ncbi:MAG TPA: hypothetical protein DCO86_03730 [Spirochaetaceae bacterium]|nr:hypothetical protein [Spirochaetaceae bacterium]
MPSAGRLFAVIRRLVLCSVAAVLLIACGIPNYFYLGSSYINVQVDSSQTPSPAASVSFQITDPAQLSKCVRCPSICLFYFLDNGSTYMSNKSKIKSDFATRLGAESNKGALFSVSDDGPTKVIDEFSPSDDQSVKISIYPFAVDSGFPVSRPSYHIQIPLDENSLPATDTIRFKLIYDPVEHRLYMRYPLAADDDESQWFEEELLRSGGKSFSEIAQHSSDFENYKKDNPDLGAVNDSKLIKINIMAALCASEGSFNNIYWSRLNDLSDAAIFDL